MGPLRERGGGRKQDKHFKFHFEKLFNAAGNKGPLISANSKRLWENPLLKTSQGRGHHRKSAMCPHSRRGFWKGCHPWVLPCRGKRFIWYIWLSQNHMRHQFYKITSNLTTPPSSWGKTEREKSTGHSMTHWISIDSISNRGKIPGASSPPPPSLLFQLEYSFYANYSGCKTKVLEQLTSRCVCLLVCLFAFNPNKYPST